MIITATTGTFTLSTTAGLSFVSGGNGQSTFTVTGRGVAAVPAFVVDKVAVLGVYPDLRRAAKLLSGPGG